MTDERAAEVLERTRRVISSVSPLYEAAEVAIKRLREPVIHKMDCISRRRTIEEIGKLPKWIDSEKHRLCFDEEDVMSVLSDTEKIPQVPPEGYIEKIWKIAYQDGLEEGKKQGRKKGRRENMDDLISRQAAVDALVEGFKDVTEGVEKLSPTYGLIEAVTGIYKCLIGKLPPTEPKRGKWIKTARWGRVYYCDQCRNYLDFDGVNAGRGSTNFCPNCGAKMEGVNDE